MSRLLETWETTFGSFADNSIPLAHNGFEEKNGQTGGAVELQTPPKLPPEWIWTPPLPRFRTNPMKQHMLDPKWAILHAETKDLRASSF
jgi:hypothetical protein